MAIKGRNALGWPVAVLLACLLLNSPASANFTALSASGSTGPGGTITTAVIGPVDPNSANVNTDFTGVAAIPLTFQVSDDSPVSIYGSAVNDTGVSWSGFVARVVTGSASFRAPNDPSDPYGTYSDSLGFGVTLSGDGRQATFSGGIVAPGDALDLFLGLVVGDPSQPVTLELTPVGQAGPAVPEPASLVLLGLGLGLGALVRAGRSKVGHVVGAWAVLAVLGLGVSAAHADGPVVAPAYAGRIAIHLAGQVGGRPTQMTFGPEGRLYVMTADVGAMSYGYDPALGTLTGGTAAAPGSGIGLGFHNADLYLTTLDGSIRKLRDGNGNGVFGEPNELDIAIVTGIPVADHSIDQIQIAGDTLYVGIGRRTINGRLGAWTSGATDDFGGRGFFSGGTGRTYGDSAYNGTIAWIRNLNAVEDRVGGANGWALDSSASLQTRVQRDDGPFRTDAPGKLVVHSAGTRNPFGLCLDGSGNLWFTNNYNRTATLGNGQTGFGLRGDQPDVDLSKAVYDQVFRAAPGADYGYFDANWRGVNPMMTPGAPGYRLVRSTTFDNSYNRGPYTLHDPARPDGLGPSSSSDGIAWADHPSLPSELRDNLFIVRFNNSITEGPGGARRTLAYSDLIAVDPVSGTVRRVASGFNGPLAVLSDPAGGRLLVANYGDQSVYSIQFLHP